jgi:hypothetical protein
VWWKGKPVDVVLDYLHDVKEIAPDPIRVVRLQFMLLS